VKLGEKYGAVRPKDYGRKTSPAPATGLKVWWEEKNTRTRTSEILFSERGEGSVKPRDIHHADCITTGEHRRDSLK